MSSNSSYKWEQYEREYEDYMENYTEDECEYDFDDEDTDKVVHSYEDFVTKVINTYSDGSLSKKEKARIFDYLMIDFNKFEELDSLKYLADKSKVLDMSVRK